MPRRLVAQWCRQTMLPRQIGWLVYGIVAIASLAAVCDTGVGSLFFTTLTAWGTLALLLIVGLRPAMGDPPVAGRVFDLSLLGLLFIGGLSAVWWTVDPGGSDLGLIKLANFILLGLLLSRLLPMPSSYRPLLLWLTALAGGLAVYGFLQWPLGLNRMGGRLHSLFLIPNSLAGFLAATLPLTIAMSMSARSGSARGGAARSRAAQWGLWLLAMIQAAALAATGSRGGWLAASAGVTLALILMGWRQVVGRMLLAGIAVFGCAVVVIDRLRPDLIGPRAASLTHLLTAEPLRYLIWQGAIEMIKARPLTGWGVGAFGVAYVRFKSPVFDGVTQYYAHNDYLQMAAELGLPGLLCWLCVIGATVWMVGRTWRGCRESSGRDGAVNTPSAALSTSHDPIILAGVAGGGAAVLLHGLVDFDLYVPAILAVLAVYLGYIRSSWQALCGPRDDVESRDAETGGLFTGWRGVRGLAMTAVCGVLALMVGRLYLAESADRAGRQLMDKGRYEEAVARFVEARAWDTRQAAYDENLGFAYEHWANQSRRKDLLPLAEVQFRRATQVAPSDYRYYWNLGRFYKNYSMFSAVFANYDPWSAYRRAADLYPTKMAIRQELDRLVRPSGGPPTTMENPLRSA